MKNCGWWHSRGVRYFVILTKSLTLDGTFAIESYYLVKFIFLVGWGTRPNADLGRGWRTKRAVGNPLLLGTIRNFSGTSLFD